MTEANQTFQLHPCRPGTPVNVSGNPPSRDLTRRAKSKHQPLGQRRGQIVLNGSEVNNLPTQTAPSGERVSVISMEKGFG